MIEAAEIAGLSDLAQAAYIHFDPVPVGGWAGSALDQQLQKDAAGWPPARREEFTSQWRVVAHQPDTASGFSATLFERLDPAPGEPRYAVAMRGTEQFYSDLLSADAGQLVGSGLAWKQILDMYNWWESISTPTNSTYNVATSVPLSDATALARIAAGDTGGMVTEVGQAQQIVLSPSTQKGLGIVGTDEQLDITGHSLGGHLATAFARLFPADTASVVTINGAGYGITGSIGGNIDRVFAILGGASSFDVQGISERILNLYGDRGLNIVTQNSELGLKQPGSHLPVFIENNSLDNVMGHGAAQLLHSLALYETFRRLEGASAPTAPADMLSRYRPLLDAAANDDVSFERSVDALHFMLVGGSNNPTPTDALDTFYSRLYEVLDSSAFEALSGKVSVTVASSSFTSQARQNFNALLALQCLSPYALECKNPQDQAALDSTWQQIHGELYLDWAADRNAALYGDVTHAFTITDQWISDRAQLLSAVVIQAQQNNDSGLVNDSSVPTDRTYVFQYFGGAVPAGQTLSDVQTLIAKSTAGTPEQLIAFGDDQANLLQGTDNKLGDHLYGAAGDDILNGEKGDDYLEGDSGNDTLKGGEGNDTLVGGVGRDTYVIGSNTGRDIVLDADGQGALEFVGSSLSGAGELLSNASQAQSYAVWLDNSNTAQPIRYSLNTTTQELTITGAGSSVIVKNFKSGDLGIAIPATSTPTVLVTQRTFDLSTNGAVTLLESLTSEQRNAGLRLDNAVFADGRYLGQRGGAGNDIITGGLATAPVGTILNGLGGDDRLWAGAEGTLQTAIAAGETAAPNGSATLMLAGGEGNDQVVGAAGDDVLFGGTGDDTLVGGSGNDIILADGDNAGYASASTVTTWSTGANTASGPGRSLRLRVDVASLGETNTDSTGRKIKGTQSRDTYIDPLANTDLSGLLAMRAENIVPPAGDTNAYIPGSQRTYAQLNDGKAMATNVGSGADTIYAGAGDDTVNAGAGDDIVFAGSGIDAVAGYEGDDIISGGEGADTLWGDYIASNPTGAQQTHTEFGATWSTQLQLDPARHGRDIIDGGEGNDTLYGGGQADELYGGAGDDIILGDDKNIGVQYAGDDYLDGGSGNDSLDGGAGSDELVGGLGNDVLRGDSQKAPAADQGNDSLDGGAGDDTLYGGGKDDTLIGGDGDDDLFGDDDPTSLTGDTHGKDVLDGGNGADYLIGGGSDDILLGGAGDDILEGDNSTGLASQFHGNDRLEGGDGKDTLLGNGGNDVLIGGKGLDYFDGGEGDDRYIIATEDIDANTGIAETITDAGGRDTVELQGPVTVVGGSTNGDLVLALGNVSEQRQVVLKGGYTGAFERIVVGGQEFDLHEWLQTNATQAVNLTVQSGQAVWGAGGADRLSAASGATNVTLNGGKGNDYYDLSTNWSGGATIKLQLGDGIDTVKSGNDTRQSDWKKSKFVFGSGITSESLQLAMAFDATSQSLQLSLSYGTQGDRIFLQGSKFDTFELADGSSITWQQLADKGVLINMADNNSSSYGGGTSYRDIITGRSGNDSIYSYGGDDVINGGAGNDTIYSHDGNDVIDGGAGNDKIYGGQGSDVFLFGKGDGQDQIINDSSDTGDQDVLRFKAGVSLADVMFIRSGDDLVAKLLNSTDKVTVVGAYSTNPLHRVEFADGRSIRLADLSLATGQQQATAGSDVINLLAMGETVDALAGDDTVRGGAGNDTIDGNAGTDTLYGGSGNDTIRGGDGYDSLYGEAGDDRLEDVYAQYMDGGDGNDTIIGNAYQVFAGAGDDWVDATGSTIDLTGGGNDTVVIRPRVELGSTVIQGISTTAGQTTTIRFASGINPASIKISSQEGKLSATSSPVSYLLIEFPGTTNTLSIAKFMELPAAQQGIRFVFDDAPDVVLNYADVYALANTATGLNNTLWGTSGADTLDGLAGNDTLHGLDGNDTLIGGAGNDTLYGGAGDDVLVASSGRDNLYGGQGNDTYKILDGSHVIYRDDATGRDIVEFGAGIRPEDIEVLHPSQDSLLSPNDALLSGKNGLSVQLENFFASTTASSGIQEIRFTDSPQTVWTAATLRQLAVTGNDGNNRLNGFDGLDDVISGGAGNDRLEGGTGNDTLNGGAGYDYLIGGAGNDTYQFERGGGQDILTDSAGTDTVQLGAGILPSDVTLIRTSSAPTNRSPGSSVHSTSVDSLVIALASGEQLWIPGHFTTAGAIETIRFADGTTWAATDINTRLINSVGTANTQTGTSGNDTYTVDNGSDQIIESANGGIDLVNSSASYALPNNVENLTLTGILNINAYGNEGVNVITGNAGDNVLDGGNDSNADTLIGGQGNDTYIVRSGGPLMRDVRTGAVDYLDPQLPVDVIVETAGGGNDTLVTLMYAVRLPNYVENLVISGTSIFSVPGGVFRNYADAYRSYTDGYIRAQYVGNVLDNVIDLTNGGTTSSPVDTYFYGGALVDGGAGADRMIGGNEDTYYMIDNVGDVVVEKKDDGKDAMISSTLSLTVAPNVEGIELLGSLALSATGDAGNNDLRASKNTASNVLTGLAGDDTYYVDASDVVVEAVGGGNDLVIIDQLRGGASIQRSSGKKFYLDDYANVENIAANGDLSSTGNSFNGNRDGLYLVGNRQDNNVSGSYANDTLEGGAGNDVIEDQYQALAPRDGIRVIDNDQLYGGDGDDRLISYFGADLLDGGAGNDTLVRTFLNGINDGIPTLRGGLGNDTYELSYATSLVVEDANSGIDTVRFFGSGNYTLGDNVENLELKSSGGNATGNELANLLTASAGDNILDGLGGLDTVSYQDATAAVNVSLAISGAQATGGSGSDTLLNIERLTGSRFNDTLTGNTGTNTLDGGAGNDVMTGGAGNDTYIVDSALDVVTEGLNEGTDTVKSAVSYALSANVENLTLTGSAAIDSTGNELNNSLTGNEANNTFIGKAGNDTFYGGGGNDTMIGGTGDDTYSVDGGDVVTELLNEGTDLVQSSVSYTLGANVENLTLTGTVLASAPINATGNELANVLTGNAASNTLNGAAGNDTLNGGAGNDTLIGGMGNDLYRYRSGDGNDRVQDEGGDDTVELLNLKSSDVRIVQGLHGDDDLIVDRLTGQSITLNLNLDLGSAGDSGSYVEHLRFADGTVWNAEQMRAAAELERQTQLMVQTMATISAPAAGSTTPLMSSCQANLVPTLAPSWG